MSVDPDSGERRADDWRVLARHDWTDATALEISLHESLAALEPTQDEALLYDYVDVDAVRDVIGPGTDRGVSEVRFDYGRHEVKVAEDGTVATR